MRGIDLFAGLEGWASVFRERGHSVDTLDNDPRFGSTFTTDFLSVPSIDSLGNYDFVAASPPCETFSTASMGHHWGGGLRAYEPKTPEAERGLLLAQHLFNLVHFWLLARRRAYVIENPRGVMRKVLVHPQATTWYCQYGESRAKPTDIWTNLPMEFRGCRNNNPACGHERAPRGAKTGTQGIKGYANRSLIPRQLALEVCVAAEKYLS